MVFLQGGICCCLPPPQGVKVETEIMSSKDAFVAVFVCVWLGYKCTAVLLSQAATVALGLDLSQANSRTLMEAG